MATDTGCSCGCSTLPTITNAHEACGCGCECCSPHLLTREQEVSELHRILEAAERRLAEIDAQDR